MPKVKVNHFYCGHAPGEKIDVSEEEAKRLLDTRGGTLVEKETRKAVAKAPEDAETREGMTTSKAHTVRKSEK